MDIKITGADQDDRFLYVARSLTDGAGTVQQLERAPKEVLAIRAAEYDLEPDDDFVLDLVLLEPFIVMTEKPGDLHPLFSADSVADALEIMRERAELARVEHGAPKGKNRLMAAAIRNGVASPGLVTVQRRYRDNLDPRIVKPIRYLRDRERERLSGQRHSTPTDLTSTLIAASDEHRARVEARDTEGSGTLRLDYDECSTIRRNIAGE